MANGNDDKLKLHEMAKNTGRGYRSHLEHQRKRSSYRKEGAYSKKEDPPSSGGGNVRGTPNHKD